MSHILHNDLEDTNYWSQSQSAQSHLRAQPNFQTTLNRRGIKNKIYLIVAVLNLHAIVSRTTTTFRNNPVDILAWVLDITGFAVYAILSIDL